MRSVLIFVFCFPLLAFAAEDVLHIGETLYQPGCGDSEWPAIEERLRAVAEERRPDELAALASLYLCQAGPQAGSVLKRHLPAQVRWVTSGSGQPDDSGFVLAEAVTPREGAAWGMEVHDRAPDVAVFFYVDEACAQEVSFSQQEGDWLLVQIEDACD